MSNAHAAATVTAAGKPHAAASAATNAASATSATPADLDHETVVVIPGRKRGERPGHLRSGGNCACNDRGRGKRRQVKAPEREVRITTSSIYSLYQAQ